MTDVIPNFQCSWVKHINPGQCLQIGMQGQLIKRPNHTILLFFLLNKRKENWVALKKNSAPPRFLRYAQKS